MTRRMVTVLMALCLMLCVAVVALWVRSYFVQDAIYVHRSDVRDGRFNKIYHSFYSVGGQLIWQVQTYDEPPQFAEADRRARAKDGAKDFRHMTRPTNEWSFNPGNRFDPWWIRLGFRYDGATHQGTGPFPVNQAFYEMGIPHWLPVAVAALLPGLVGWRRWRRHHRHRDGLCRACGYELTGNVSGVCPECGTPAPGDTNRETGKRASPEHVCPPLNGRRELE